MKIRTLTQGFIAGIAALTFASGAFATDTIRHQQETDPFGTFAPAKAAVRVIKLNAGSKYLNVERGETVTIVKGEKAFTWKFDTFPTPSFALAKIAPNDFGAGQIRVYVTPNPDERSN